MSGNRAGRTGDTRRRTGQGGIVIKRCSCGQEVLSAYRGAVTAVGAGVLERVESNGDVIGRCRCGQIVTWVRALPAPLPSRVGPLS